MSAAQKSRIGDRKGQIFAERGYLMKKERIVIICLAEFLAVFMMAGCGSHPADAAQNTLAGMEQGESLESNMQRHPAPQETEVEDVQTGQGMSVPYTADTFISDVTGDPIFGDYGRLIFPVDAGYRSGDTLGNLRLTWYSNIDPNKTVEITNYVRDTIFYDIYTDEEKAADPAKADTGLFFFKGNPGEKFAVCNAGGGFAYVGAMHDSFPHALELSKRGYNAFALIYRPGAQTACEDLARAISFIFEHAEELEVDTDCYSLWGGSAGARMAAYLGSYGPSAFGGNELPGPGTVVMQYTSYSEYTENDPPTYVCVGDSDGIASWRTMEGRLERMSALGSDTEFHKYPGIGHGFGLGTGTVAEGWIEDAITFWEKHMQAGCRSAVTELRSKK